MDENARKRKREEEEDSDSESSVRELGSELPREGLKRGDYKKKPKQSDSTEKAEHADKGEKEGNTPTKSSQEAEEWRKLKAQKKAEKKAAQRERKKAKLAAKKAKAQEKAQAAQQQSQDESEAPQIASKSEEEEPSGENDQHNPSPEDNNDGEEEVAPVEGFSLDSNSRPAENASTASSNRDSPGFDVSNDNSGSSSISSIAPSNDASDAAQKPASEPKPLKPTPEELRQRLQKRLEELRAARHADGLNGKPARNRQELIEARRQKREQRKAHKKEMRRKAKEEEQRKKDEDMARRFSPGGAGSLLASPRSPAESNASGSNNYAFGRIAFSDGQIADPSGTRIIQPKQRGPQDPATALKAAEAKKARLEAMDSVKRAEIEEKDMWLNAKKKAHGEKVRDDTSLLKKALKRKAAAKRKSEREWKERLEGVAKAKEMKQQKREENLRKRKEEKKKGKAKARPGFEGSFKAKVGGKKK